jgi:hypothetical protein
MSEVMKQLMVLKVVGMLGNQYSLDYLNTLSVEELEKIYKERERDTNG